MNLSNHHNCLTKHILPAAEDPFALLRVDAVDKVCGVVFIGILIPEHQTTLHTLCHLGCHVVNIKLQLLDATKEWEVSECMMLVQ